MTLTPDDSPRLPVRHGSLTWRGRLAYAVTVALSHVRYYTGVLGLWQSFAIDLARTDGFMDWDQVNEMAQADAAFGGRGAEHRFLTHVTEREVDHELLASRQVLAERFNNTVPTFSCPNGYLNYDIVGKVRASGFRLAFTTQRGFVYSDDDKFMVRRPNVHESMTTSKPMFMARMVGFF